MRKTIIIAAIIIAFVTGCKKEQPQDEKAAEQKARQEAFEKQLKGYPTEMESFLFKTLHTEAKEIGRVSYRKGQQMTIRKDGKEYTGKNPEKVTALWADGNVIIPGGQVLKPKKKPETTYTVRRDLEDKVWGYHELLPYVKKYPLTLRTFLPGGMMGGVIQTLEEYLDIAPEYGNPRFVITDVVPYAAIEGGGEHYLMGEDNPWKAR